MLLFHETTLAGLTGILIDKKIKAYSGNLLGDDYLTRKAVYLSILFPSMIFGDIDMNGEYSVRVFIFINPKILERNKVNHWCPAWIYGHYSDAAKCVKINKKLSEKQLKLTVKKLYKVYKDFNSNKHRQEGSKYVGYSHAKGSNELVVLNDIKIRNEDILAILLVKDGAISDGSEFFDKERQKPILTSEKAVKTFLKSYGIKTTPKLLWPEFPSYIGK